MSESTYTPPEDWITHPSGVKSRPLPDGWPPLDRDQGFTPPYYLHVYGIGQPKEIRVSMDIFTILMRCTNYCPVHYGECLQIIDSENRVVINGIAGDCCWEGWGTPIEPGASRDFASSLGRDHGV